MSMIQRMNAAKNLCNVDPKILTKVNCSMTSHLLVLSSNPAILDRRGSTPVSTVLRKSVRKGDLKELESKKFPGGSLPPNPLRSLRLRRSFWKSVSIYPRSAPAKIFPKNLPFQMRCPAKERKNEYDERIERRGEKRKRDKKVETAVSFSFKS